MTYSFRADTQDKIEILIVLLLDKLRGETITRAIIEDLTAEISELAESIISLDSIGIVDPEEKEDLLKRGVIFDD